jgi:hypothetical protein
MVPTMAWKSPLSVKFLVISCPRFHLSLLGCLASLWTWGHLVVKVGTSKEEAQRARYIRPRCIRAAGPRTRISSICDRNFFPNLFFTKLNMFFTCTFLKIECLKWSYSILRVVLCWFLRTAVCIIWEILHRSCNRMFICLLVKKTRSLQNAIAVNPGMV